MKEPLTTFKPEDYLYDDASLAIFLTQSLNDGSEADLRGSLDIGARARGHTDILAAAALPPSILDRLQGNAGTADLDSVRRALASLGLRLAVVPADSLELP